MMITVSSSTTERVESNTFQSVPFCLEFMEGKLQEYFLSYKGHLPVDLIAGFSFFLFYKISIGTDGSVNKLH